MRTACSFMLLLVMAVASCDSGKGQDSLFNRRPPHTAGTVSPCTRCHSSSMAASLDPLVTGGSGTAGKHIKHVTERGIDCEVCHRGYQSNPNHMNGTLDAGSPLVSILSFSLVGPAGTWVNDTGPQTGSCSGIACHGTAVIEWYGTSGWTLPACTECHASAFSAALDPVATNGSPPAGRHVKHVSSRGIGCERCHYQYPSMRTHANGQLDAAESATGMMQFNIVAPQGAWTGDTGPQTGQCAAVSCHGVDTLAWYGTSTWTLPSSCITCHASSYSSVLDPVLTNGSGVAGKHVRHVSTFGFSCAKCHQNYTDRSSHASGALDTPDPATLLVYFDATNSAGTWTGDIGQESGSCALTDCHAAQTPEWYGTAGAAPSPCVICHVNAMGTRRPVLGPNGDFGANAAMRSHHVTRGPGNDPLTDQCLACHDQSNHMGGTVLLRNADTGTAIAYSSTNPSSAEPFCLSCHDTNGATATFTSGGTPTSPFIDGSVMGQTPYRASAEINTHWNKTFGHRQKGLTCLGNGSPNTGCHPNGHGSGFVGILARNLALPSAKTHWYAVVDEPDYDLCFTCHASYAQVSKEAILGMRAGGNYATDLSYFGAVPAYTLPNIQTLFRDVDLGTTGKSYDDPSPFSSPHENLHMYHLQIGPAWNYRGSIASSIVCLSCHSVHGSNTQWGWVHDELLFNHFSAGADQYGMIGVALNQLGFYPTSCTFNCHDLLDTTHSWYEPSGE